MQHCTRSPADCEEVHSLAPVCSRHPAVRYTHDMSVRKTTMKSLAEDLGVSRSAVSFVLNGEAAKRRIPPETAQRILARAKELNFRPDFFAQALNTRKTGAVGLVFPDVHEAFMSEMLRGIDQVFARNDAVMMLSSSRLDRNQEARNLETLIHRGIDGLIIVPCADFRGHPSTAIPLTQQFEAVNLPVVMVDRIPDGWQGDSVVQDDFAAARQVVSRLVAKGCRRVACVTFDLCASSLDSRVAGYVTALSEAGLEPDQRLVIRLHRVDSGSSDLELALRSLLAQPTDRRPDGWFITTAGLALRTRELLQILSGPGPLPAMARFGSDSRYQGSLMYGVAQPHQLMGQRAAELLFQRLEGGAGPAENLVLLSHVQTEVSFA